MTHQISLVQTMGGTISQVRAGAETHTLIAKPTLLYVFARWEQSVDGGETWTAMEGDARTQITLEKDTMYRAVFESPYKVSNMESPDTNFRQPEMTGIWIFRNTGKRTAK